MTDIEWAQLCGFALLVLGVAAFLFVTMALGWGASG